MKKVDKKIRDYLERAIRIGGEKIYLEGNDWGTEFGNKTHAIEIAKMIQKEELNA